MRKNNQFILTAKNLDRISELLIRELKQPKLSPKIPDGAHLFYGSYDDPALTKDNLRLVSKILLGMTLGYVEEAPLIMVFDAQDGQQKVIDLSDRIEKDKI